MQRLVEASGTRLRMQLVSIDIQGSFFGELGKALGRTVSLVPKVLGMGVQNSPLPPGSPILRWEGHWIPILLPGVRGQRPLANISVIDLVCNCTDLILLTNKHAMISRLVYRPAYC